MNPPVFATPKKKRTLTPSRKTTQGGGGMAGVPGPHASQLSIQQEQAQAGPSTRATEMYATMLTRRNGLQEASSLNRKRSPPSAGDAGDDKEPRKQKGIKTNDSIRHPVLENDTGDNREPEPQRRMEADASTRNPVLEHIAPSQQPLGIATYNINHLSLTSEKKKWKLAQIHRLLRQNTWLEIIALQEVNNPAVLEELSGDVKVLSLGPILRTIDVLGKKSQSELYPLITRRGSGWKVKRVEVFHTDKSEPEAATAGEELVWRNNAKAGAKQGEGWRPVVIYRLENEVDGRCVNVGVVHTSPRGTEFARTVVYEQVKNFLKYVNRESGAGEHWVVLGDFYLTPEARVPHGARRSRFAHLFPQSASGRIANAPRLLYPNLSLAHPISASNWPTMHQWRDRREKMQIADFMITSRAFQDYVVGVFDASAGGIWPVDWDHRNLQLLMKWSDHVPLGGLFSMWPRDADVEMIRRANENRAFTHEMRNLRGLLSLDDLRVVQWLNRWLEQLGKRHAWMEKKLPKSQRSEGFPSLDTLGKRIHNVRGLLKRVSGGGPEEIAEQLIGIHDVTIHIDERLSAIKHESGIMEKLRTGGRRKKVKPRRPLEITKDDALFFLQANDRLPTGQFTPFTHDLPGMLVTLWELMGWNPLIPPAALRAVETSTSFRDFLNTMGTVYGLREHARELERLSEDVVNQVIAAHRLKAGGKEKSGLAPVPTPADPLDALETLGFTRNVMSGIGNDCAIRTIHDQLTHQHGYLGIDVTEFIKFVRARLNANVRIGAMIDILNQGAVLLNAVQDYFEQVLCLRRPSLRIDVWMVTGGELVPYQDVAHQYEDGEPPLVLTFLFNGHNHFDSLIRRRSTSTVATTGTR